MYEIEITAEDLHHHNELPEKVRHAALQSIFCCIAGKSAETLTGRADGTQDGRWGETSRLLDM